jgi:hypothetical protein
VRLVGVAIEAPLASGGFVQHAIGAWIWSFISDAMLRDVDLYAWAKGPMQSLLKHPVDDLRGREGLSGWLLPMEQRCSYPDLVGHLDRLHSAALRVVKVLHPNSYIPKR